MAFPVIASKTFTVPGGLGSSIVANLPATINAGDLLIFWAVTGADRAGSMGSAVDSTSDTWAVLVSPEANVEFTWALYYKIADGDEDGGTVTVSWTTDDRRLGYVRRYTSWHGTTPPEVPASASGDSNAPDPPSRTASWGSEDTLWEACCAANRFTDITGPDSYTFNTTQGTDWDQTGAGVDHPHVAVASRENATTTENPGAFAITATSETWLATTIAIRPAAAAPSGFTPRSYPRGANRGVLRGVA